jgi:murein DD-endopeptidase MepM/ murein hydrolase activator NlpD
MPRDGGSVGPDTHLRGRTVRMARVAGGLALAVAALATLTTATSSRASADVKSDQAQVAQLGAQIAQDGATIQRLVVSYDQATAHEAVVEAQLDAAKAHLVADRKAQQQATGVLRQLAITNYMSGASDDLTVSLFNASNITDLAASQQYSQVASGRLDSAIAAVEVDAQRTEAAEAQLTTAQTQAQQSVAQLAGAQQAAQAALTRDDTLLGQAKGNLAAAVAAAAEQRAAAEEKEEEEMAAAAAAHPVSITFTPSPGAYANPLRAINALNPERVDQGVDYSGYGPIFAIGDGTILSTVNAGWPGGTFIAYRLSNGPAGGLTVYAAEDIDPLVSVGQTVTAATVIGTMYEGPDGIETGWADPSGDGVSMANDAGQFSGANSTAFGANFSQLLAALGAPPGVMQNEPATGVLPANWPSW